jgi:hypothetical protein
MNNTKTVKQALVMYKETVSPSQKSFQVILSQIPEQNKQKKGRVIRSPYIWLAVTQAVMLCSILFVTVSVVTEPAYQSDPFYQIDKQVDDFDASTNQEDYEMGSLETTL